MIAPLLQPTGAQDGSATVHILMLRVQIHYYYHLQAELLNHKAIH